MYTAHFGLKEAPFSITPDPRYLYMSEGHREALAHLLYGIGEGGGFVQLTGEVGTGKTTLCRCFLEQLPPHVDVALILNPRLTAVELLATVCGELRIPYPAGTTSLKVLVDALYRHLLAAHERGRRTVLIIDEAQNLPTEVLEQIRLLTNLETTREKLLQIILIGQPELIRLLERPELRQLAQRVTARYHLRPFSPEDTRACVRHRLEMAGQSGTIFSEAAIRRVHRLSGGVPRLISIICDRALLGAYAQDRDRVDARTVRRARAEVLGRRAVSRLPRAARWIAGAALVGAAAASVWIVFTPRPLALRGPEAQAVPAPGSQAEAVKLADLLVDPAIAADRDAAYQSLLARWGVPSDRSKGGPPCGRERVDGLACLTRVGTWRKLRAFNLPAVIELATPAGEQRYATVTALDEERVTLAFGEATFTFAQNEVERFWEGPFTLLWKPPTLGSELIEPGMRGRDVERFRQRLDEIDGQPAGGRRRNVYDDDLKARVVAFQRSRSLVPDGIVGPETLVHLSTAVRDGSIPLLRPAVASR